MGAEQCFGLSDEGIEDAIYDSQAIRGFVGIDLAREAAPDRPPCYGHIGHNKFVVYVGQHGQPQAVLSGGTNWTQNGLCTQSNSCYVAEHPGLWDGTLAAVMHRHGISFAEGPVAAALLEDLA